VTRRLLLVAAAVAISGLAATPALEETAVGGWFVVPWDGSRGQGQPGQQGEPTAPPPTLDRQDGNGGQPRLHAKPRPHGHRPKVRRPKAKPDTPADTRRPARNPHARRGQVAGSPDPGRAGDGDSNQLLAVPRGHRPHDGGRQRVEVTVSLTLLAVARAEPGWPQPDRHHRSAAVLVGAHSADALVAVGPPRLRLPRLEWRPRGGSTRSGSGVAPPRSSRGRHPGPSRRTRGQPSAARRRRRALVELCSAPVTPAAGGWPRAGPL
jgi:hypothetical protein